MLLDAAERSSARQRFSSDSWDRLGSFPSAPGSLEPVTTSLMSPPVADVLDRLFADAARTRAEFHGRRPDGPRGGRGGERGPRPPHRDEREFFARAKHLHLAVSRNTGTLLYLLARNLRARAVVEFGTSFGVSLIHLAAAVRDNGGGTVIGTEYEPGKVAAARRAVREAGLADVVDIREGDAAHTLTVDLPDQVDLLFLDGAKGMYRDVLTRLEPRLRPGALVVADNAGRADGYLEHVRTDPGYLSTGFLDEDIEISWRVRSPE